MHAATVHAIDSELKTLAADERRGLVQFLRRLDLLDREGGFELFKCGSGGDPPHEAADRGAGGLDRSEERPGGRAEAASGAEGRADR